MTVSEEDLSPSEDTRRAELSTHDDDTLGACLYLTPEDLRDLDVDPETADAIEFHVDDTGRLVVDAIDTEGDR